MDLCGIALASHTEAGKSFAFVLSFFDNSSITFAADSLGLYYKILLIKNVLYVVYYHSSMTFAADSLGLLSDMRVFVCVFPRDPRNTENAWFLRGCHPGGWHLKRCLFEFLKMHLYLLYTSILKKSCFVPTYLISYPSFVW